MLGKPCSILRASVYWNKHKVGQPAKYKGSCNNHLKLANANIFSGRVRLIKSRVVTVQRTCVCPCCSNAFRSADDCSANDVMKRKWLIKRGYQMQFTVLPELILTGLGSSSCCRPCVSATSVAPLA